MVERARHSINRTKATYQTHPFEYLWNTVPGIEAHIKTNSETLVFQKRVDQDNVPRAITVAIQHQGQNKPSEEYEITQQGLGAVNRESPPAFQIDDLESFRIPSKGRLSELVKRDASRIAFYVKESLSSPAKVPIEPSLSK